MKLKPSRVAVIDRIILGAMIVLLGALTFSSALVEISFVIAAALWIGARLWQGEFVSRLRAIPHFVWLFSYVALVLVTSIWSENYELSFKGILKVLQQFSIFVLAFDTFKTKENLIFLVKAFLGICLVAIMNGFYQYGFGKDFIRGFTGEASSAGLRVSGSFKSYGLMGAFMAMAIPVCYGVLGYFNQGNSKKMVVLSFLAVAGGLTILFLTRSRGAALAFLLGTFALLVIARQFKILLFLAVLGGVGLAMLPKGMIIHLDAEGKEQSLVERYYLWDRALHVIKAKPLFGTGINTYAENHMAYDQTKSWRVKRYYAHNGYLQMAAETGVPSLAFYLMFIGTIFVSCMRYLFKRDTAKRYRMLVIGFFAGSLNFCILAIVDTVMHNPSSVMTFWYLLGGTLAALKLATSSDSEDPVQDQINTVRARALKKKREASLQISL